ncbi:MAG TPA: glycosyltransferase [Verrucomicrobiae bacterium]
MSSSLPMVTIIVPTRPGQAEIPSVAASRALDYPPDKLEIIVTRGRQPAVQRNVAIRAARGELIYFLDDDCLPAPANLRRAVAHFARPEVKMVSGPNLCPPGAPLLEQVFAVVQTSWLAFGPSVARYAPVGDVRESSEKEIIGCNLLSRRDVLLELGGFHEALYPNEDHPLYAELQRRGDKLIYDPGFIVHRRPRPTLKAFLKMLMNYGRGRAEELRLDPTFSAAPNFVPPLFCLYLVLLPLLFVVPFNGRANAAPLLVGLPLGLYALVVVAQTIVSILSKGVLRSLLALPLVMITHVFYGLGFWWGLFTRLRGPTDQPPTEVVLETISV